MTDVLFALLLAGCEPSGPRTPRDYGDVPTDTFPQFYGTVPKNIVMISIDTLRRDHLDRYADNDASPFMTARARAGVAADDHHQCSNWTYASMSCTVAGRHNEEAGMIPQLSTIAAKQWTAKFNPRPVGEPELRQILQNAM